MNEEAAFMQAMEKSPHDVGLRLVFADWLEERGDPRGELLRLLHMLTQPDDVANRSEAEARLQTLVDHDVQPIGPFRTNSLGMRFAWIHPGTFLMGNPSHEKGSNDDEPQRPVTLTTGFFLGAHPVTQEQWRAVMDKNRSIFQGWRIPVENVDPYDAGVFCKDLGRREGKPYRLPTEAEWEYACRAGSTTAYGFGDDPRQLAEYAWYWDNSSGRTHAVGRKKPNAWGLHDMHGNVWEWTSAAGGVARGGSWNSVAQRCQSVSRYDRANPSRLLGFRVVLVPSEDESQEASSAPQA
jgi:uncharacterized protein (TIGR02996 family)